MTNNIDQSDLVKAFNEGKLTSDMNKGGSKYAYYEATIGIKDINVRVLTEDIKKKIPSLKNFDNGLGVIIFTLQILDGNLKNQIVYWAGKAFNKNNEFASHKSFEADNGDKIFGSTLGEIIHYVKEYDEDQWSDGKLNITKIQSLKGAKFKLQVRQAGNEDNKWIQLGTEYQLAKDEEYKKANPKDENIDSENSNETEIEINIETDDINF